MDVHSSPARTPKLQLAAEQPLTGECWIPPKEDATWKCRGEAPARQQRRRLSFRISLRISPHTRQRCSEGLRWNLVCTSTWRPHRGEARPAFGCLSVSCGGTSQQWPAAGMGALTAADPGHTACGTSPPGEGLH